MREVGCGGTGAACEAPLRQDLMPEAVDSTLRYGILMTDLFYLVCNRFKIEWQIQYRRGFE